MAQRRRRIVPRDLTASLTSQDATLTPEPAYDVVEEWVPEPVREYWTPWERVEEVIDEDPTYSVEYDYRRATLFHVPIRSINPRRKKTVTYARKLIRRWVDVEDGPMAEVVRTETHQERY